ncbi:MAG: hypothetical protein KGZ82_02540 [Bacteroidales bacterium]|nr:hypothetical protein [Bacteroidales bacterium]
MFNQLTNILILGVCLVWPSNLFHASEAEGASLAFKGNNITVASCWEKTSCTEHLLLWQRWLNVNQDHKVRERKCNMMIPAKASAIVRLLRDNTLAPEWMSMVDSVQLLAREGNDVWYNLAVYKMPWPFHDKYLSTRVQLHHYHHDGIYRVNIVSDMSKTDAHKTINDIGNFAAEWTIVPVCGDLSFVEFTAHSVAAPLFPRWIQDPIIDHAFANTMENFYALALKINKHEHPKAAIH